MHDVAAADDTEIPNLNYIDPVVDFLPRHMFSLRRRKRNKSALISTLICFYSPLFPPGRNVRGNLLLFGTVKFELSATIVAYH